MASDRVSWNADRREKFIHVVLSCMQGNFHENGSISSKVWAAIEKNWTEETGLVYSRSQLQNQLSDLKKRYISFKKLKENSGLEWNEELNIPIACGEKWDEYVAIDKRAKEFRNVPLANYVELRAIFDGKVTAENYVSSSVDMPAGEKLNSAGLLIFDKESDGSSLANSNPDNEQHAAKKRKTNTVTGEAPVQKKSNLKGFIQSKIKVEPKPLSLALKHFYKKFVGKLGLSPADRLKFGKVLAENPNFAELYLSLDDEAKELYILDLLK